MTCIVGVVDKQNARVVIGADDGSVQGSQVRIRRDPKVFRIDKRIVIAFAGSYRVGQLIRFNSDETKDVTLNLKNSQIEEYLADKLIPGIINVLETNKCLIKENGKLKMPAELMVGIKDELYVVGSDFQIASYHDPFTALGVGKRYALGFLRGVLSFGDTKIATGTVANMEDIVFRAIGIAAYFDHRVCNNSSTVVSNDRW